MALWLLLAPSTGRACDLALVLAVDVSGSVDSQEYRIQMDGLAAGLRDGIVSEALVDARAMIMLLQWTGSTRQKITQPWVQMMTFADIEALAQRIEGEGRAWKNYSTAIGEALEISIAAMAEVSDCKRHVIDLSGDGLSNEGREPQELRAVAQAMGITINAVAIEGSEDDLTAYFFENVIAGDGAFVETATGFEDYPDRIRRKLQRETTKQLSAIGE